MVDLERALQFSADLAQVSTVEEFTRFSLSGLAALVPAKLWGFNDLDPASRELVAVGWPVDGGRPGDFEAVAKVVWEHPVVAQFQRTGQGPPTRISDVWSRQRYRESALYRDAYRAMGVEYQVSFSLADGPVAATIGFAANRSDREFGDDELELLGALRPALRASWQRVQATSALATTIAQLRGEGAPDGLMLVDAKSRVRAAPPDVVGWLRDAGVNVVVGDTVPEPLLGWLQRGSRHDLVVGSDGLALRLEVAAGAGDADRVVAVHSVVAKGSLWRLTPRELEILRMAAAGKTNAEIAGCLAISVRTVQKHLERSFDKLGVRNRTAAAALLASASPPSRLGASGTLVGANSGGGNAATRDRSGGGDGAVGIAGAGGVGGARGIGR